MPQSTGVVVHDLAFVMFVFSWVKQLRGREGGEHDACVRACGRAGGCMRLRPEMCARTCQLHRTSNKLVLSLFQGLRLLAHVGVDDVTGAESVPEETWGAGGGGCIRREKGQLSHVPQRATTIKARCLYGPRLGGHSHERQQGMTTRQAHALMSMALLVNGRTL